MCIHVCTKKWLLYFHTFLMRERGGERNLDRLIYSYSIERHIDRWIDVEIGRQKEKWKIAWPPFFFAFSNQTLVLRIVVVVWGELSCTVSLEFVGCLKGLSGWAQPHTQFTFIYALYMCTIEMWRVFEKKYPFKKNVIFNCFLHFNKKCMVKWKTLKKIKYFFKSIPYEHKKWICLCMKNPF